MFIQKAKNIIKRTFFYHIIRSTPSWDIIKAIRDFRDIREWEKRGKPFNIPHGLKVKIVKEYGHKYNLHTFIETGTYLGEMIWAVRTNFNLIYSIELDDALYNLAKNRFARYKHISIIHGDSGKMLPHVLKDLSQPSLFWLDGHYSEGITAKGELITPIYQELTYIASNHIKEHVILIDDAREFNGQNDYPTINELRNYIMEVYGDCIFEVKDDIIRIHRKTL